MATRRKKGIYYYFPAFHCKSLGTVSMWEVEVVVERGTLKIPNAMPWSPWSIQDEQEQVEGITTGQSKRKLCNERQ